jgi:hypothetical protein
MEIQDILNAILVNEGVRPAMLIQPVNYNEISGKDTKTLSVVNGIKELFPELLSSDNYTIYQGTILSKKLYGKGKDKDKVISLNNMGEILGYPCFSEYETLNRDEPLFNFKLLVSYNNGKELSLFNNICKDKNTVTELKSLSTKAFRALTNVKYKGILKGLKINRVYVDIENIIPRQYIINKLINKKKLSNEEIGVIIEVLYNMGFGEELKDKIQYNNPIHIGILLDILLKDKYDILSPFYPLQEYPTQQKEVDKITIELENALIDILDKTKTISKTTSSKTKKRS